MCYLHTTKDVPDGMVCVSHKAGHIEHLFVTEKARGNGIGAKLLDFARKKLPEHTNPTLTVLNTNARAIALYKRMGWVPAGTEAVYDPAKDAFCAVYCEELRMSYRPPVNDFVSADQQC